MNGNINEFLKKTMGLAYVDVLKYFFHTGRRQSNLFVANVSKINALDENVLESKRTLTV